MKLALHTSSVAMFILFKSTSTWKNLKGAEIKKNVPSLLKHVVNVISAQTIKSQYNFIHTLEQQQQQQLEQKEEYY